MIKTVGASILLSLVISAAGCGSQLSPGEVQQANGGAASPGATPGAGLPGSGSSTGSLPSGQVPPSAGLPGSGSSDGAIGGSTGPGTSGPGTGRHTPGGSSSAKPTAHPTKTPRSASCDGFNNSQPGVTDSTITIANASDISGPVPGLFTSAQQAVQAFAAYFNASSDICGHKLQVEALDSRTDAGADQEAYATACSNAFAAVGSMSAFDYGGAGEAAGCGLPDLRSTAVSDAVNQCATCFSAQGEDISLVPSALPLYFSGSDPDAVAHAGFLYLNAQAGSTTAQSYRDAFEQNGWHFDVFQGIDVSDFNYAPYVAQLQQHGVQAVVFLGAYQQTVRLQQAMQAQNYQPKLFLQDATIYNNAYVEQAGSLGNGTYTYTSTSPLSDTSNPEMALYQSWLQQVHPGAVPDVYGVYAWSAARLFTQEAQKLGGKLTRASLVQALQGVADWTDKGLHGPEPVGAKQTDKCTSIIQLDDGTWSKVSPGKFICGPLTDTGVS